VGHAPTFGAALVVSPSVWWADQAIRRQVAAARLPVPPPRVWLDIGGREREEAVVGAQRLHEELRAAWLAGELPRSPDSRA